MELNLAALWASHNIYNMSNEITPRIQIEYRGYTLVLNVFENGIHLERFEKGKFTDSVFIDSDLWEIVKKFIEERLKK